MKHRLLQIFSFLGILITGYLIYQHYKPAGDSFCNVSQFINCDIVNKSEYSELFGIPVSILGFLTYVGFFVATFFRKNFENTTILAALTLILGIGVAFSGWLTYVEFFKLYAICIFCLAQQILILLLFAITFSLWHKKRKS